MSTIQIDPAGCLAAPNPAPRLEVAPHPNGLDGIVALRRSEDEWQLEQLRGPTRGRRVHEFADLESCARWLKLHALPARTEILLDHHVAAALNPVDPTGDLVTCLLGEHPTFASWAAALDKPITQPVFQRLIRLSADSLAAGDTLSTKIQHLRLLTSDEYEMELDAMGLVRVEGKTRKSAGAETFPPEIALRTPTIVGVCEVTETGESLVIGPEQIYDLQIYVSLSRGEGGLLFTLSCPMLPIVRLQARRDAALYFAALLGGEFEVGLGKIAINEAPDRGTVPKLAHAGGESAGVLTRIDGAESAAP